MVNAIDEHREDLEALADRKDLRCSKYAKALLEAAAREPDNGGIGK